MSTNGTRLTRTQAWVLALTSAASLMVSLDTQVVATALPVIRLQLHASLAELEWTVNAYTLTFAVLLLTGAALGERLGRRRLLAAGVGLFTAASAACALAQNATTLVAARAVQGAGAALMLPLALALLSAAFPPQRRAWALGIFSSVTGIAVLAGPVVGGAVAQGPGLAVDLLAERPDRAGHDPADPGQDPGSRALPRQPRSRRTAAGRHQRPRYRLGLDPG